MSDPSSRLGALIRRLRSAAPPPGPAPEPAPIEEVFVRAFLQWEATPSQSASAYTRLRAAMVDLNELRVFLPHEIAAILGERYPLARERAVRLHSSLNDVFRLEHAASLARLATLPKREAAQYLAGLDGMTPYVASRVMLHLGAHSFPLDGRLLECLQDEGVVPSEAAISDAAGWIERHVPAGELSEAFALIEAYAADASRKKPRPEPKGAKRAEKPAEKPAKKRPAKKPATPRKGASE